MSTALGLISRHYRASLFQSVVFYDTSWVLRYHNQSHSRNSGLSTSILAGRIRTYRLRCDGKSKSVPLMGISASTHKASAALLLCCHTRVGTSYRRFYGTESKRLPMSRYVISIWRRHSQQRETCRVEIRGNSRGWLRRKCTCVCVYALRICVSALSIFIGFLDIVSVRYREFTYAFIRVPLFALRPSCKYFSWSQKTAQWRLRRNCWIRGISEES